MTTVRRLGCRRIHEEAEPDGRLLRVVDTGLTEGHGITLVREDDSEYRRVSDPGFVFSCGAGDGDPDWTPLFGKGVHCETRTPRVVKMNLDGQILSELPIPPQDPSIPAGPMGPYCPCGCVVDEERFGGTGDIWVADGYGSGMVHRFDKDGSHLLILTGEEGSGRLLCPHAIFIDRRNDPKRQGARALHRRPYQRACPRLRPRGPLPAHLR